jgi:hypothetical protein
LLDTKDRLPKGVLGICYSYYSACSNDGIWYVNGYDIQFRDTTIWHLGSGPITRFQYDMESVMMHELGHGQQLNHVINQADLMHYSLKRATIKRTINPSNTEGAKSILNASIYSGACNYFPLQLVNSATCSDPKLAFYTLGEMEINPNPFFEMATAFYYLDAPAHVTIDLYSVIGQKITTLADEDKPAGKHLQTIDPLQNNLNKGVYIIRLVVGDHEYSKKIVSLF